MPVQNPLQISVHSPVHQSSPESTVQVLHLPVGQEYDPEADLSEGDVAVDNLVNPTVVRVHIKASKTDPFRQGVYVYLGATGNDLCPVATVSAYLVVRGREPGPFFKLDVSQYLGHSFRIGAATTAAAAGFEDSLIKTLGRAQPTNCT